jgi:hypothetical protein
MWQVKPGHEHNHIDGRSLQHNVHLFDDVTGAEHRIHLLLKADSCPACHRPFPKDSLGHLDPKAAVADALKMLGANLEAVMAYAHEHGVPIVLGPLATSVPAGHRLVANAGVRALLPPKKEKV